MSNKEAPVSVLLSVYKNEQPDYLFEALNSLGRIQVRTATRFNEA